MSQRAWIKWMAVAAWLFMATCAPHTAGAAGATGATGAAETATCDTSVPQNVKACYGLQGDGSTDDTANLRAAITAAAGSILYFPAGTYVLDNLPLTTDAHFKLDDQASLFHSSSSAHPMIALNWTADTTHALTIEGGIIDGNKAGYTSVWRDTISGNITSSQSLIIHGVHIQNTVRDLLWTFNFGGLIEITDSLFTGQAFATPSNPTAVMFIETGESDAKGLLRFNHNRLIASSINPASAGSSPGGIFFCTRSNTSDSTQGNYSTLEAIGNYFWGYGQNAWGQDIAAIHFYPATGGARIIGNYFEESGFVAIYAKSVTDFVADSNVILNGQTNSAYVWTEGAIGYTPGYMAGTSVRPRAVISNNIIDTPGGQSSTRKAACISVRGTPTSYATDVIVSNNVVAGCGAGIYGDYITSLNINGGNIQGATGGTVGAENGIELHHTNGSVDISNLTIWTRNGFGIN